MLLFVFITAFDVGVIVTCRGFPRTTFIEVGSSSGGEPPQLRACLLPPSLSVAKLDRCAPSPGVLSHAASITLHAVVVVALQKEPEDALGATEDARREVEEEQLGTATAENIHDAAQVEVAHMRMELEGMGRSLPLFLPTNTDLRAALLVFSFDAPCPCRCKVEGGGSSLDGAAPCDSGGGGQAVGPP